MRARLSLGEEEEEDDDEEEASGASKELDKLSGDWNGEEGRETDDDHGDKADEGRKRDDMEGEEVAELLLELEFDEEEMV
jgi:hypothetical protein